MFIDILIWIMGGKPPKHHHKHRHHHKTYGGDFEFSLYLNNNQIIKGKNMTVTILKSQFKADANGGLVVTGHIKPTDNDNLDREILADSAEYDTTNEAALTIAKDAADQKSFSIAWVGAGEATIGVSAKSLDGTQLTDTLDIVLVDDSTPPPPPPPPPTPQATKLNMSLDL
jgi:hypothetical protein